VRSRAAFDARPASFTGAGPAVASCLVAGAANALVAAVASVVARVGSRRRRRRGCGHVGGDRRRGMRRSKRVGSTDNELGTGSDGELGTDNGDLLSLGALVGVSRAEADSLSDVHSHWVGRAFVQRP